jgi:succinate dehydrogenase / fumarate reductase membrane anchor subunit
MVKRVIVGAHYGMKDWLAQRVTALVMLAYTLLFCVVWPRPPGYAGWKALFSHGWMRFATFLMVASLLIHAWIGMRNIWMDYVKPTGVRLTLQVATILWLVGCAGWAMQILWR